MMTKQWAVALSILVTTAQVLTPVVAAAQKPRPIQIALVNPVQIFAEDQDITGLRFNFLYGRNADVKGVDLGFIAGHTTGNGKGVQWNLVNVAQRMYGLQVGLVNVIQSKEKLPILPIVNWSF